MANIYKILQQINKSLSQIASLPLTNESTFAVITQHVNEQMSKLNRINFSIQVPDIYFASSVIDKSKLTDAINASNKILEVLKVLSNRHQTCTQQIADATKGLDLAMQRITADLAAFKLSFQNIISSGIIDDFLEIVRIDKATIDAFKAASWPIAPSMSRNFRKHIIDLHVQGKTRYISNAIIGYYHRNEYKNLKYMVDTWQNHPLFAPRIHIIKDALRVHYQGSYTLSIPALLPQIEGILNEYVLTNNLSAKLGKIQKVYDAVIWRFRINMDSLIWVIANTLLYQLQTNTYVYTDFENEMKRAASGRRITRHTVLHGVTVNYNRPINSLRIFVLLDAISVLPIYKL
ncbi:MAG: hypothetical protein U5R06_23500 [candidate division KSB1 bacterium]|nr:hypothetical protein [candidate division KSB1 bacterium]